MGMTIDGHIGVIEDLKSTMSVCMPEPEKTEICTSLSEAIETMRKYQQLQADYENRLKADMLAILTELQLDIEKHTMTSGVTNQGTWNECIVCCSRVIQQEINKLKENKK